MKTKPFLLRDELRFSPNPPAIYLDHDRPAKVRFALLGSFHGGYHVLKELLSGELADRVAVVGVATDDPTQPFVHAEKRLWRYPHTREEELLVPRFAAAQGLPGYSRYWL